MIRLPPRSTRTDPRCPYTSLFLSLGLEPRHGVALALGEVAHPRVGEGDIFLQAGRYLRCGGCDGVGRDDDLALPPVEFGGIAAHLRLAAIADAVQDFADDATGVGFAGGRLLGGLLQLLDCHLRSPSTFPS